MDNLEFERRWHVDLEGLLTLSHLIKGESVRIETITNYISDKLRIRKIHTPIKRVTTYEICKKSPTGKFGSRLESVIKLNEREYLELTSGIHKSRSVTYVRDHFTHLHDSLINAGVSDMCLDHMKDGTQVLEVEFSSEDSMDNFNLFNEDIGFIEIKDLGSHKFNQLR